MSDPNERHGITQEALELHQDLEVRRFIRRTFKAKIAANLLSVHTALCELAATTGSTEGEWDHRDIGFQACLSEGPVSHGLLLLEQYGLVEILARRNDKGHKVKPIIKIKNIPREVLNPIPKSENRGVGPIPRTGNRGVGDTTTGGGESAEEPQVDDSLYKVGFKTLRSTTKSSAGGTGSPAHASAPPSTSEEAKPKPSGKRKYFMLPSAQEDWAAPWSLGHRGAQAYWSGKEVDLWSQFENSGVDRGTRKLMVLCYLRDKSEWLVENQHPLGGLVKNGPRYQKQAEEFLRKLDLAMVAHKYACSPPQVEPKAMSREEFNQEQINRRRLKLTPLPEPPDLVG